MVLFHMSMPDQVDIQNLWFPSEDLSENYDENYTSFNTENDTKMYTRA